MSLQSRLSDLITAIGTDIKQLRIYVTGTAGGNLGGLTTTAKSDLVAAVNEVNAKPSASPATELISGTLEIATQTEVNTGTDDVRAVTPLKFQTRLAAYAQPLAANLTSLAGQASTAYGRAILNLADQAGLMGLLRSATEAVTGISRFATQAETNAGTIDTAAVTPLKFQTRLAAYAQPLAANLTTLAGVASGDTGRTLLTAGNPTAAKTTLGLAAIASSGSAADLTGTIPTSILPPLAINETFEAASQAAMLALTAQRGDVAIRTDIGRSFILAADDATILANWKQLTAGGDVSSVAGRTGAVVLTKADVGLSNVDNTTDAAKPISTATQSALDQRLIKSNNLSDVGSPATARSNLGVYSTTEIGNPETDLVALYTAAKA